MTSPTDLFIVYSEKKNKYWSDDFGWCAVPANATTYSTTDVQQLKAWKLCSAPDALFVSWGFTSPDKPVNNTN